MVILIGTLLLAAGIAFVVILLRLKLHRREVWQEQIGPLDVPERDPGYARTAPADSQKLRHTLFGRSYLFYVVALALQSAAFAPVTFALDDFLDVSLVFLLAPVGIGLFVAAGVLSDIYDRKMIAAAILFIQMVIVVPLAVGIPGGAGIALTVMSGAGLGSANPANLALQRDYFGRERFGLLLGIQMSVAAIPALAGPILVLGLKDLFGIFIAFTVGSFIPLAVAFILVLLMKRPQYENAPAESEPQVAI